MTVKVAINGVSGRMGKALIEAGCARDDIEITVGVARATSSASGRDCGEWAGVGSLGTPVVSLQEVDASQFQVWVDFTLPQGLIEACQFCQQVGKPMVIGSTGLDAQQTAQIEKAARSIPIVWAPNMSVGVNVCLQLLQQATRLLGEGYDVEIIEAHHRHKKDAPSGTALRMGEVVASVRNQTLDDCAVYGREGSCLRAPGEIGFETIRAGDIVGEHTVLFAAEGERIEIVHKASSRLTFAHGALRAASWLMKKEPGLYDMRDVLGLS